MMPMIPVLLAIHDASDSCRRRNVPGFELTDSQGVLASSALVRQLAGSEHCPWTVRTEPGQRIVLKLTIYRPGSDTLWQRWLEVMNTVS